MYFGKTRNYIDIFEDKAEWCAEKKCRKIMIGSCGVHICIILLLTIGIVLNIKEPQFTYTNLGIIIGIDVLSIVGFCISYILIQVIKRINDKNKYILVMANKYISCRLYLDIGEYYMLFLNGKETYIRKTEVKEIICDNIKSVMKRDKKKVNEEMLQGEESLSR